MLVFAQVSLLENDKARMNSRYVAAKLFFVSAAIFALVGAVLFRRDTIATGLAGTDYLNPLFLVMVPRLTPFAGSILSAFFGLVYYAAEKGFKRPLNMPLTVIHFVSFAVAILCHATLVRFWWTMMNEGSPTGAPIPLLTSFLMVVGLMVSLLAFGVNIVWSMSRAPLVAGNPR